jgi:2-polyprenyl-3-methyl-5-hydroxy-6-metoxy-1,4-benzoquinol methylase
VKREHHLEKDAGYFAHTRRDLIALLPNAKGGRILEIGCALGHTLAAIRNEGLASEVVGVELLDLPRTAAERRSVDRYIVGNIETDNLDLDTESFDVVICGDVLEHLNDPWSVMRTVHRLLRRNGVLVASVPNVREVRTLYNIIIRGDFAYADAGVLDRTHLRFFCRKNILDLLTGAGGRVERISSDLHFKTNLRSRLNTLTFGLLHEFLATQYLVVVRKL